MSSKEILETGDTYETNAIEIDLLQPILAGAATPSRTVNEPLPVTPSTSAQGTRHVWAQHRANAGAHPFFEVSSAQPASVAFNARQTQSVMSHGCTQTEQLSAVESHIPSVPHIFDESEDIEENLLPRNATGGSFNEEQSVEGSVIPIDTRSTPTVNDRGEERKHNITQRSLFSQDDIDDGPMTATQQALPPAEGVKLPSPSPLFCLRSVSVQRDTSVGGRDFMDDQIIEVLSPPPRPRREDAVGAASCSVKRRRDDSNQPVRSKAFSAKSTQQRKEGWVEQTRSFFSFIDALALKTADE